VNYLLDFGAFVVSRDGTFSVNPAKIKDGIAALTRELMILEAEGSYSKAKDLIVKLGIVRPEVQRVLDKLAGVPVDIEPIFVTTTKLGQ